MQRSRALEQQLTRGRDRALAAAAAAASFPFPAPCRGSFALQPDLRAALLERAWLRAPPVLTAAALSRLYCRPSSFARASSAGSAGGHHAMAGLELLYNSVAPDISCAQDALVCYVHWKLIAHDYRCLGAGDQPGTNERKSELLPSGWNAEKDLYTLRYRLKDDSHDLLLKGIRMDGSMIFNVMDPKSQKVADLTVKVTDYIDPEHLADFDKVYKNTEELQAQTLQHIISPFEATKARVSAKQAPRRERNPSPPNPPDHDPLWIPPRYPLSGLQPNWQDPMGPFVVGGDDLDPLGHWRGGMISDPLRTGVPHPIIDPSTGLPNRLPPGAVPPGARFDPYGPPGANRSGPNPDHFPPPGFDDMFM